MENPKEPQPGDVLFIRSPGFGTTISCCVQALLDPNATAAVRWFGHVAIMITPTLAVEAMPAPKTVEHSTFDLAETVERGQWTQSELRGGVRLIPIADLVIPAIRGGAEFVALRSSHVDDAVIEKLEITNQPVIEILGSKYSIDQLKSKAEEVYSNNLPRLVDSKQRFTSVPLDLATRLNIDSDTRSIIEKSLPDFSLPAAARSYLCSQLVVSILEISGLLKHDPTLDLITPTGLYQFLLNKGWNDESLVYQWDRDPNRYLNMAPLLFCASYTETLAVVELALNQHVINYGVGFLGAALGKIKMSAEDVTERMLRIASDVLDQEEKG